MAQNDIVQEQAELIKTLTGQLAAYKDTHYRGKPVYLVEERIADDGSIIGLVVNQTSFIDETLANERSLLFIELTMMFRDIRRVAQFGNVTQIKRALTPFEGKCGEMAIRLRGHAKRTAHHNPELIADIINSLTAYERAIAALLNNNNPAPLKKLASHPEEEIDAIIINAANAGIGGRPESKATQWLLDHVDHIQGKYKNEHGKRQEWQDTLATLANLLDNEPPADWVSEALQDVKIAMGSYKARRNFADRMRKARKRRNEKLTLRTKPFRPLPRE